MCCAVLIYFMLFCCKIDNVVNHKFLVLIFGAKILSVVQFTGEDPDNGRGFPGVLKYKNKVILSVFLKHRKNCECCPVSQLIVR